VNKTEERNKPPKRYSDLLGGFILAFSADLFSLVLLKVWILKINSKNFGNCYELGYHKVNKKQGKSKD